MFCFSSTGETTWSFLLCWQLTAAAAAAVVIVVVAVAAVGVNMVAVLP